MAPGWPSSLAGCRCWSPTRGSRPRWPSAWRGTSATSSRFLHGAAGAVAVGSIWLLAAVNIRGVAFSSGVIRGLAVLKLGVLGFLVLWGLGMGHGDWSNFVPLFEQRPGSEPLVGAPDRRDDRGLLLAGGLVGREQDRRRGP